MSSRRTLSWTFFEVAWKLTKFSYPKECELQESNMNSLFASVQILLSCPNFPITFSPLLILFVPEPLELDIDFLKVLLAPTKTNAKCFDRLFRFFSFFVFYTYFIVSIKRSCENGILIHNKLFLMFLSFFFSNFSCRKEIVTYMSHLWNDRLIVWYTFLHKFRIW